MSWLVRLLRFLSFMSTDLIPLFLELRRKFDPLEYASRAARDLANIAERAHDNVDLAKFAEQANTHVEALANIVDRQTRVVLDQLSPGFSEGASPREVLGVILKHDPKDWEFPAKDQEMVELLSRLSLPRF